MEKAKSPAAWIMQWAGKQKILYALSIVLTVFNVLFKLIPFFIIGDVINRLINGEKDLKTYLIEIAMIAGSFVIAEIFHSVSTAFSHKATFSVLGFCSTFGMFIGYEENFKNAVEKTKALNNHYDCA